jgi:hypothetical protein
MRPTLERLQELFRYEPETGHLIRRITVSNHAPAGARAGAVSKDRRQVQIDGKNMAEHIVIYAMIHGAWPIQLVDHIDGDGSHNTAINLRDASAAINQQNRRKAAKHNKCGVLGVVLGSNGRFSARLRIDGRQRHLGCFGTAEEAHVAYIAAKRIHHPGCTL